MAYNEQIADRVYKILIKEPGELAERKMFGALCFMLNGNMVCGVQLDSILLRVPSAVGDKLLERPGVRPMMHGDREMKGFLFIAENEYEIEEALLELLEHSLAYVRALPPKKKKG